MPDHEALDSFIRAILTARGVRIDELDDTAQDTWIALLTRNAFEKAKDLKPYIARIAINIWKDRVKKDAPFQSKTPGHAERAEKLKLTRGRTRIRKSDTESIDAKSYAYIPIKQSTIEDQLVHRADLELAVKDAMQRLTRRQFRIVTLKMQGHRTWEIAKKVGLGVQQVQRELLKFREGAPSCLK